MTKVMFVQNDDGTVYFDCLNHAGDESVCTIVSTLCNVAVQACLRCGHEIKLYEPGHVTIMVPKGSFPLNETLSTVMDVMGAVQEQHPDYIKIY